jgi:hypothetical protein
MPQTKQKPSRKHLKKAVPVMGAVGASMALAGGAYATGTVGPVQDVPLPNSVLGPQVNLSEEEIFDVSLKTFFVFDKENFDKPGQQYARGCGGCRGCRGCGGCGCRSCRSCAGCSGCSCGCCASWGACRFTC